MRRLRDIAEAGMAAHDRMMELGRGISALTRAERNALDDYDETFSEAKPTVLALLDVAEAAEWYELEPCEYYDGPSCADDPELLPAESCGPCCARSALARLREVASDA